MILVTGGAGYIGSHTCVELLNAGEAVVVLDDLSNSSRVSLDRVQELTGKQLTFYQGSLEDRALLERIFTTHRIDCCIHFAGLKAVGESVRQPLRYYRNNLSGTLTLLEVMARHGVKNIIFSSSATVYGTPERVPIDEDCPKGICTNPYGWTKSMLEQVMTDLQAADPDWNVILLRYFNPVGAHASGRIGEDPSGVPNNLLPYIAQVAVGKLEKLHIYGDDYPTPDGTGVRDYIHVVDLARGHVAALSKLREHCGLFVCNLGTGRGYSVLEMLHAFERACGRSLPYVVEGRRAGDVAISYADPRKAWETMGWRAELGIDEMCASSWKWQSQNPNGYR